MNTTIAVILSTYNGEKYLSSQLDSIFAQTIPVDLYVRDDGSSDGTADILLRYQSTHENMHVLFEENLGCTRSFLTALQKAPNSYKYYAFCDQDDIWHQNKLKRAIELLEDRAQISQEKNPALLYCSEYNFCTEDMTFIEQSQLNKTGVDFYKCLFENVCSGNTMVFNQNLRRFALCQDLNGIYCHDWWLALTATCFGQLIFDHEPSLEYRRTGSNVSPTGTNAIKLLIFRIKTFIQKGELKNVTEQLATFLNVHRDELSGEYRQALELFTSKKRIKKMLFPHALRQKSIDELPIRTLLLLNAL